MFYIQGGCANTKYGRCFSGRAVYSPPHVPPSLLTLSQVHSHSPLLSSATPYLQVRWGQTVTGKLSISPESYSGPTCPLLGQIGHTHKWECERQSLMKQTYFTAVSTHIILFLSAALNVFWREAHWQCRHYLNNTTFHKTHLHSKCRNYIYYKKTVVKAQTSLTKLYCTIYCIDTSKLPSTQFSPNTNLSIAERQNNKV